jgi:2-oxoglutarate ferredoxin oxidoreductase subunit alpha
MQVRWGASGDYEIIALSPWSVQEAYEETIHAFNLADQFRVPVFLLMDEAVGHMRENLMIGSQVPHFARRQDLDGAPFGEAEVPPMPSFGQGARLLVTGSTHDAWGYRRTTSAEAQGQLVERLTTKIANHRSEISRVLEYECDDADLDVLLVAYGFTARSALAAVHMARAAGVKAGLLRLVTLWPFPEDRIKGLLGRATKVIVPEMNRGQVLREVQRWAPHAVGQQRTDGEVISAVEVWQTVQKELAA